ncbi:hypothetical protein Rrhod_0618 [Rhodococcus rhodnii LMG 5362]|uniref:Uncharacterized protein n=1 Tax=Rhodococcus rhodnii LMG 5362 TaxID=1273125 RepID=R7WUY0_9NOCA|nr:hypothetical protein Rrhod_0618 [Rhodococcus rhodnii LMG 5362]
MGSITAGLDDLTGWVELILLIVPQLITGSL